MKKALKALLSIACAGALLVVGVFAATNSATQSTSASVSFVSTNAAIDIKGRLYQSNVSPSMQILAYSGATFNKDTNNYIGEADAWTLMYSGDVPAIVFTHGIPAYIIEFDFTNHGDRKVDISVTQKNTEYFPTNSVNFSYAFRKGEADIGSTCTLDGRTAPDGYDKITLRMLLSLKENATSITSPNNIFAFQIDFVAQPKA